MPGEPPPESARERVARLKAALAEAETEALDEEMSEAIDGFLGLERSEIPAAIEIVREAWAKFEAWRRARAGEGKRPAGLGSVQKSGKGYQWRFMRDGKLIRGKVRPTQEEAQAELDRVIADPGFVPVACDGARLQNGKHHCGRCGSPEHRANRCPQVSSSPPATVPTPATIAPPSSPGDAVVSSPLPVPSQEGRHREKRCAKCGLAGHNRQTCNVTPKAAGSTKAALPRRPDPIKALLPFWSERQAERLGAAVVTATRPEDLQDLDAWSAPDESGRQTCTVCDGEGIDRRAGGTMCCLHCDGDGYRWPETVTSEAVAR